MLKNQPTQKKASKTLDHRPSYPSKNPPLEVEHESDPFPKLASNTEVISSDNDKVSIPTLP